MLRALLFSLAVMILPVGASLSTPAIGAESVADPIAERFITELERKAIDRYLRRRGVPKHEREVILDPDEEYGLDFDDDDEGASGYARKNKHKGKKHKGLPPGLAKRDQLPPGLAKRSELPPGLAKRDLPQDLRDLLPARGGGYELKEIDGSIILIDIATNTVLDIIEGALNREVLR